MRIGIMAGATGGDDGLDALVATAKDYEVRGFDTLWLANIFGIDAIMAAAIIGRETKTIRLGTAVVPTYPRHPTAIAQQALTAGAACGGRSGRDILFQSESSAAIQAVGVKKEQR